MKIAHIAKIARPKLSGAIRRDRLFHLLDQAKQKPVVWVEAQAGSGKTTLVAGWLDERKPPYIWYQVDEGDADIASFFYYMGLAARGAAPRYKKSLPVLTAEYLHGIPVFTRRYFEELFCRLASISATARAGGFVIVLDNYQDAPISSGFHDVIARGMDSVPEGITFVVLSRAAPPPALTRLQANNRLCSIGWEDIRFTREESLELLQTQGHGKLSAQSLDMLHDKTEGWAAGLILLAGAGKTAPSSSTPVDLAPDKLFDYFASEIFDKADADAQDFLLKTSFLQRVIPAIAGKLTGNARAVKILERMSKGNYFTQKYGEAYQYHPLFREFLQLRSASAFAPAKLSLIQRSAAELLATSGHVEDAARLYRDAKDWDGLVRLISSQAQALVAQGRSGTVADWIAGVPVDILTNKPWLLYWLGIGRMAYNPTDARGYLEAAFALFEKQNDISGLFLSWSSIIETFVYEWRDFRPVDHWIAVADKLIAEQPGYPSPEIEARVVSGMFNALYWRQPQHPDLPKWAERLHHIVLGSDSYFMRLVLGNNLFQYHVWMGQFTSATLLFDVMQKASSSPDNDPLAIQCWCGLKAMYSWFAGDYETCLSAIADGVNLGEKSGVHLLDSYLFAQGIYSGLTLQHPEFAEDCLTEMAGLTTKRTIDQSLYHHLACSVKWHRGKFSEAVVHGELAVRFSEEAGSPFTGLLCRMELAMTLFDMGRREEAECELARSLESARGLTHIEFVCRIFGAWFATQQGKADCAMVSLRAALAIGARQNYINFSRWQPQMMSRLCAMALEHGIEVEYVQELIKKRGIMPLDGAVENWPYPIKLYTLGRFEIVLDGEPLRFIGKVQKKPLELLLALASFGGREVSESRLCEALWEGAEADAAHTALAMALHRLRKLLGDDDAVLKSDNRISLNPGKFWVDAWAFERIVAQAGIGTPSVIEVQRVLNLYQGTFLGEVASAPWALSAREKLRAKFLRFAVHASNCCQQQGRHEETLKLIDLGLEAEPLAEELYRSRMRCEAALGKRAEALATYLRCETMLATLLEIEPSAETRALYQALRKNQPLP